MWRRNELVGGPCDGGILQSPPIGGELKVVRRVSGNQQVSPRETALLVAGKVAQVKDKVEGVYCRVVGKPKGVRYNIWVWEDVEWESLSRL